MRFAKSPTVAIVDWHFVLSIVKIAVWTGPVKESH